MKFTEALSYITNGGMVTTERGTECYKYDYDYDFYVSTDKNKPRQWKEYKFTEEDVLRDDYRVIEEQELFKNIKLYSFEEAFTALKNGKKIARKENKDYIDDEIFYHGLSDLWKEYDALPVNTKAYLFIIRYTSYDDVIANDWLIQDSE